MSSSSAHSFFGMTMRVMGTQKRNKINSAISVSGMLEVQPSLRTTQDIETGEVMIVLSEISTL